MGLESELAFPAVCPRRRAPALGGGAHAGADALIVDLEFNASRRRRPRRRALARRRLCLSRGARRDGDGAREQ